MAQGGRAGRRGLAARHADGRPRPELPRATERLGIRVSPGHCFAGRTAGGYERVQVAAAPLDQGLHSDLSESAAADLALPRAVEGQGRGHVPSDKQFLLSLDGDSGGDASSHSTAGKGEGKAGSVYE